MVPTHTCDCGAPGLSTTISFAGVVSGDPSAGCAGVPFCHAAERLRHQRLHFGLVDVADHDQRRVVGDEVLLPERLRARRASIALFEASVPISM